MFITEFGNNHPQAIWPCRYAREHKNMTGSNSAGAGTMFPERGPSAASRLRPADIHPSALRLCENRISFARFAKSTAAVARCGRGYATIRKVLRESQNPGLSLQPTPFAL